VRPLRASERARSHRCARSLGDLMNGRGHVVRSSCTISIVVLAVLAITGQLLGMALPGAYVYDPDGLDAPLAVATATNTWAEQADLDWRDAVTDGLRGYDDPAQLARASAHPDDYRLAPKVATRGYALPRSLGAAHHGAFDRVEAAVARHGGSVITKALRSRRVEQRDRLRPMRSSATSARRRRPSALATSVVDHGG
jgi:hypothetical protein